MFASGRPVRLDTSYIPMSVAGDASIPEPDTGPTGMYQRLAERGYLVARFVEEIEEIEVRRPTDEEATFLRLAERQPVLSDFVITITLSAADATAHVLENPFVPDVLDRHRVGLTLLLLTLLGAVFLAGFSEAIGIAVGLVTTYLALNLVVVVVAVGHVLATPRVVSDWRTLLTTQHTSPLAMVAVALLVFPKLALGLSGFETGVAVMPLVRGGAGDAPERPEGRIRGTRRLLTTAALIMSGFLVTSSFTTTVLIPPQEFQPGGEANGRALAYLAHEYLGEVFGTAYDLSTILILWFAGASAMAGLLNIVPRYLPRYGMAPDWTRAVRPLVLVFTAVAFAVTIIFDADVDAQGGAYATGVLVLILSAAIAVTLSAHRRGTRAAALGFGTVTLVLAYTTIANVIERPDGVKIASVFIVAIVVTSLISRATRSTELRVEGVCFDETARRFLREAAAGEIRLIANEPDARDEAEYVEKEKEQREDHHLSPDEPILFLEVTVPDASEFASTLRVTGEERYGYRILRVEAASVPNAIAALLLYIRDTTGKLPHVYFAWAEGNPVRSDLHHKHPLLSHGVIRLTFHADTCAPVRHGAVPGSPGSRRVGGRTPWLAGMPWDACSSPWPYCSPYPWPPRPRMRDRAAAPPRSCPSATATSPARPDGGQATAMTSRVTGTAPTGRRSGPAGTGRTTPTGCTAARSTTAATGPTSPRCAAPRSPSTTGSTWPVRGPDRERAARLGRRRVLQGRGAAGRPARHDRARLQRQDDRALDRRERPGIR